MKLLEVHAVADGRLAWFEILPQPSGEAVEVMLYLKWKRDAASWPKTEVQVCYYPGWSDLTAEQQKTIAVELIANSRAKVLSSLARKLHCGGEIDGR